VVVGSAQIGFSLSPDNFTSAFSDESDIEFAIIDQSLFERAWLALADWSYRTGKPGRLDREFRQDVGKGFMNPLRFLDPARLVTHNGYPLLAFAESWFQAFQTLTNYADFAPREIGGRLYYSEAHAHLYHADSLRKIQRQLTGQEDS
jgi:hypothetical protein